MLRIGSQFWLHKTRGFFSTDVFCRLFYYVVYVSHQIRQTSTISVSVPHPQGASSIIPPELHMLPRMGETQKDEIVCIGVCIHLSEAN